MKLKYKYLKKILYVFVIEILLWNNVSSQSLLKSFERINISLLAGANVSVSDYISTSLSGNVQLQGEYWLLPKRRKQYGFIFSTGIKNFKGKGNNLGLPDEYSTSAFSFGLGAQYRYLLSDTFSPFGELGMSFYSFSFSDENVYSNLIKKSNGATTTSLVLDAGMGVSYFLTKRITLIFQSGLHFVTSDNLDAIKIGNHNDYFADFNIGVSYNIFWKEDSDKDGIWDEDDKCPDTPEDVDGFQDDDGCPDIDNDNDGILDDVDMCVNAAEDYDGFQDSDGCPDFDNDKDRIADVDDKCPNKAEDYDGFEDTDGCPDLDNDKDGIPDIYDKCPNTPENKNGYQDDDGCPDVIPLSEIKKNEKEDSVEVPASFLLHAEQVFKSNTFTLKSSAVNKFDKIVKVMKNNPEIFWRIEGHVERQTNHAEAIELSKQLAEAVKKYLISQGVPEENLQVSALGDSSPVATNNTVFGRMKNRRVRIIRLN